MQIWFVSTYEKMNQEIRRLQQEYEKDDIRMLDLRLMSREEAVERIRESGCDIVISRGGTWRFLQERVEKPVIQINVTVYDILNVLDFDRLDDTLIVGMREVTEFAEKLRRLTKVRLHLLSIDRHEELFGREEEIRSYPIVYSDYNSQVYLESRGIRTTLLESSYQSVREAYERAVSLYAELEELKKQERVLDAYLSDENRNIYLYEGKRLVLRRVTNLLYQEQIEEIIDSQLPVLVRSRYVEKCLYRGSYFIRIYNHHFRADGKRLTAVKVEFARYPGMLADMLCQTDEAQNYHMDEEEKERLRVYARDSLPLVLSVTDEILKKRAVSEIAAHTPYGESTPFYIRFGAYTEKKIGRLFDDEGSILNLSGHIIVFDGAERLDARQRERLKEYFLDSRILAVNKVVLIGRGEEIKREIMEPFPYHELALSSYCEQKGKEQIIRSNLEEFSIPVTDGLVRALYRRPFLTEMELKRALADGAASMEREADAPPAVCPEQTDLERVGMEYVMKILREENGNRTRTAQRLGIGRTTLWRMLKQQTGEVKQGGGEISDGGSPRKCSQSKLRL